MHLCGYWWDLNPRHPACRAGVLPTELQTQKYKVYVLTSVFTAKPISSVYVLANLAKQRSVAQFTISHI